MLKPAVSERASRPKVAGPQTVELVCHTCAKRFQRFKSQTIDRRIGQPFPRQFCSRECWRAAETSRVELTCDTCGTRFSRPRSQTLDPNTRVPRKRAFCSMTCRVDAYPQRGRLVPCAYCGREVYRIPAELDHNHVCCSRTCTARLRGDRLGLTQFIAPNWSPEARERRLPKWAKAIAATRDKKTRDKKVGRPALLGPREDMEIYEDYKSGITQEVLADRYGVTRNAIRGAIDRTRRGEVSTRI